MFVPYIPVVLNDLPEGEVAKLELIEIYGQRALMEEKTHRTNIRNSTGEK